MSDNFDRSWSAFLPIWTKFCGVCDEYRILKSKWKYFCHEEPSPLPKIDPTFERVDSLVEEMNREFRPFFDRTRLDSVDNFDRELAPQRIRGIQKHFVDLSNYVGILKIVFFQRTVSSEIPHNVSDVPTSPERTIGNEMIYIAADRIARKYRSCLRLDPNLEWDGVISFIYPIQEEYFFGAFCKPSNYLRQFHVSVSEEGKHFLGSYLILAHEISHAAHYRWDSNSGESGFRSPQWFDAIWNEVFCSQQTVFGPWLDQLKEYCGDCLLYNCICNHIFHPYANRDEFRQFFADLLAFMIGGPTTCYSLVDMFINAGQDTRYYPLRPAFLNGYFSEANDNVSESLLANEVSWMRQNWAPHVANNNSVFHASCLESEIDPTNVCFEILRKIGFEAGKTFCLCDSQLINLQPLELPIQPPSFPEGMNSISSMLVANRFGISADEETEIERKLSTRTTCFEEDPRKILHCYYTLHRKGKTPEYATTLSSLVSSRL